MESLENLSRNELIERARQQGVTRPERMTREELRDEIIRLTVPEGAQRRTSRGWFGVARDLVAGVVEAGLHMPDAAALIRGQAKFNATLAGQPPVATVTLAEIYAAQGHTARAISMLDQVLEREPDHDVAAQVRARLRGDEPDDGVTARAARPEPPNSDELESIAPASSDASTPAAAALAEAEPEPASGEDARVAIEAAPAAECSPAEIDEAPASEQAPVAGDETPAHDYAPVAEVETAVEQRHAAPVAEDPAVGAAAKPEDGTGDDLVLLVAGAAPRVVWQLSPVSLDRMARLAPDGSAVVRIVAVTVHDGELNRRELDIPAASLRGAEVAGSLPSDAVLRVALGWRSSLGFAPMTVGAVFASQDNGRASLAFAPPGAHAARYERLLDA